MKIQGWEWRRVLIYAVLLTVITGLPYLVGWLSAGDEWEFNGFTFGVEDGNAYLGKMRIGAEGDWNFYLFYTPEDHDSAFGLYLPYILIGHLVRLLVNPGQAEMVTALAIAFQIFRLFASVILILAIYGFIAQFLKSPRTRWLALILATLGGGLGWILLLIGQNEWLGSAPVDFIIPEGFAFMVIYGLPHIALARAALLIGLITLSWALKKHDWRYALLSAVCWNIVGLMVTFYLAVLYAILGAWGMALWLRHKRFPIEYTKWGGLAVALTLPLFLYSFWLFNANEAFAQWSSQNLLPSPHPLHYLLGYGVLAFFAGWGGKWAWQRSASPGNEHYTLLVSWVLIAPILVYLPLNVQRRLAEGVLIPLAILTAAGLKLSVASWWKKGSIRGHFARVRLAVMLLILPSALLLWLSGMLGLLTPAAPAFRPQAELAAMDWLAARAAPGAVVMGSFKTGNFLPIRTDLRPFLGHGPETIYSDEKAEWVERFYEGELSNEERETLWREYRIQYVMFGPYEREISPDPSGWAEGLTIIYENDAYVIYQAP